MDLSGVCEACGSPKRLRRNGIYLTPLKATLYDAIERSRQHGRSTKELLQIDAWRDRKPSPRGLKSHIWQINDALEDTGARIVSIERRYVLVKVPVG